MRHAPLLRHQPAVRLPPSAARSAFCLAAALAVAGCASPTTSNQPPHVSPPSVFATSAADKPETIYVWDLTDATAPKVRIYHCRSTFPYVADQSSWTEVVIPAAPTVPR